MSTAFRITLTGGQQVPAVVTSASGLGTAIFDSSNTTLQYVINVQGIDVGPFVGQPAQTASTADDVAGMHFHNGAAGANGPIVFDWASQDKDDLNVTLQSDGSWNVRGMWELTDPASTPLSSFAAMLGSAAVGSAVDLYANFHTNTNAGGEIRGQLIAIADDNANVVAGTAGNDFLPGLGGDDNMTGGDGNDILDGGTGNDIMAGGMGNDVYVVDSVGDVVNELPGQGTDEIQTVLASYSLAALPNVENLTGTATTDQQLFGNTGNNAINGGAGNDLINGDDGSDVIYGGAGNDVVIGGPGADSLYGDDGNDLVYGDVGGTGVDILYGGNGNDVLVAEDGNDTGYGDAGNDYLYMGNGDDTASGGDGDDVVIGEAGNDTLFGDIGSLYGGGTGTGQDYLFGGAGTNLMYGGGGVDVIISEGVNDTMYGGDGGDYFYAYGGQPASAFGEAGNDIYVGSNGVDTFDGGDGQDYFYGQGGNDVAFGGAGVDVLLGQDGNDTLEGGADTDYYFGGAGSDTFVERPGSGVDVVADFTAGAGGDVVRYVGTSLTSFADVQAAATYFDGINTTIITLPDDSAVWLIGITPDQLTASNFAFV